MRSLIIRQILLIYSIYMNHKYNILLKTQQALSNKKRTLFHKVAAMSSKL